MQNRPQLKAIALFVGMLVGAGMFGIPYAVAQVGYMAGLCVIVGVGLLSISTFLAFSQVIVAEENIVQFSGYCEKHLGKTAKWLAFFAIAVGIAGALLAYLTEIAHLVSRLLPVLELHPAILAIIIWLGFSLIIYTGTDLVASFEVFLLFLLIAGVAILCILSTPYIDSTIFLRTPDSVDFFLPYGVVLFAFGGIVALPEMWQLLAKRDNGVRLLKSSITSGGALVAALYILFTTIVLGVSGLRVSESGVEGLALHLGSYGFIFGGALAIVTMSSSYLVGSFSMVQMLHLDTKLKRNTALAITMTLPIFLYFIQSGTFIQILGFVGAISSGISGILVWQMYKKITQARGASAMVAFVAQACFAAALFYPVYMFL